MKTLFLSLLSSFLILSLTAQSVSFTATADAEEILEGNYFQITYKLMNAQGNSFSPPSFADFSVLGGPNRSSQMTIVNGRTTQSMSYSYTLMPKAPGTYTIDGASIKVGSKNIKSNEINIVVLKGNAARANKANAQSGEEVFIDLELSDSIAYVGQQVTLKYVIYTSIDVRSYNFINESEYNGYYVEDLQNYKDQSLRVVIGDKQYVKQTIKAVALFPQQTGITEIGPSLVNLGIAIKSDRPSFFFSTSMRSKRITTPAKTIQILSTPSDAPESFSGAIGSFNIDCNIDKTRISMDGALTLTMKISGDGDARFVGPPIQKFDGFEVYEPNLINEDKRVINGRIRSSKTYEYLMVPLRPGRFTINPRFSYYDIDSISYITAFGPEYPISVIGEQRNQVISTENIDRRIAPIYTKTKFHNTSMNPIFSKTHVGFLSICGLAFVFLGGIKWRNVQRAKTDPSILRSRRAQKVAIARLAVSKTHLDKGEIKEFYSSLSNSIYSYLSDKQDIPVAQLSKDNLLDLFDLNELSETHGPGLVELINKCEMAIYAGFTPESAAEDYEIRMKLISDIEDMLK